MQDGSADVAYWKSTDGGLTWAPPVAWGQSSVLLLSQSYDVFWEGLIPGGNQNILHLVHYQDSGSRGAYYNRLDISTGTLLGDAFVGYPGVNPNSFISFAISQDGTYLYLTFGGQGQQGAFHSTDYGVTWSSAPSLVPNVANNDWIEIWPDESTGEPADIIGIWFDHTGPTLNVQQLDVDLGSITTTAIATITGPTVSFTNALEISSCMDIITGHIFLACWDRDDAGSNTLHTYEIFGTSITTRTSPVSGVPYCRGVAGSRTSDGKWYLFYGHDPAGVSLSNQEIYVVISSDNGVTWSSPAIFDSTAVDSVVMTSPTSVVAGGGISSVWSESTATYLYTEAPPTLVP